jgi:Tfp pilus assembly PilM family ATPase
MSKTIVGIEITEESVQAVEVKQGRTPVIIAAGEVTLPPGAARDSEVIDLSNSSGKKRGSAAGTSCSELVAAAC